MLPGYRSGNGQVEWQEIKPRELLDFLYQATIPPVLLDVRESYEYSQGHISGAILIPLNTLPQALAELDPEQSYVAVCYSGSKARRAAAMLAEHGVKEVGVLLGGMDAWEGPVVR